MSDAKYSKVGRPPTDEVDRLRARVWYWAVKARGQWSDYRLDIEFARPADEAHRSGVERRRAFEELRRTHRVPTNGTHWQREFDLISNVEAHPDFKGTADYFHSSFWTLLEPVPTRLPAVKQMLDRELKRAGLHRPSGGLYQMLEYSLLATGRTPPPDLSEALKYKGALRVCLASMTRDLGMFALLGSLFRESYLVCALEIAMVLKDIFLEQMEVFCQQSWLQPEGTGQHLLELAERRVFHWQLGEGYGETYGYDDFPAAVVERPLFPMNEDMAYVSQHEEALTREFFDSLRKAV